MTYLTRIELEEQLQNKIVDNNRIQLKNNEYLIRIEQLQQTLESMVIELEELRIKSNNSDQVRDYIYEHNYQDVITLIESIIS